MRGRCNKMQGRIEKRGNKYSYIIDIGRDPVTKKRKRKRVSGFESERKARKAMIDMMADINKGGYVEPTNKRFNEYLDDWLAHKKNRVAYSTYLHYEGYIKNHIKPALGDNKVQDLKPLQIQLFYDSLLDAGTLSERSIHHIHRIISNALNLGVRLGEIQRNVATAVDPVPVKKKELEYWDIDDVNKFIDSARGHMHFIAFYLAIFTGMRQGEILGLKWDAIDFDNKTIHVHRAIKRKNGGYELKDLKNDSSYRSISMSESLLFELKKHKNKQNEHKLKTGEDYDDQGFVVATALGTFVLPTNIGRTFRLLIAKLEVKKIRFHDLRHTHASLLFKQNVHPKIVQERLGHSTIQITLDTYSHMLPNMQEAAAQKLDEIFKAKNEENREENTL